MTPTFPPRSASQTAAEPILVLRGPGLSWVVLEPLSEPSDKWRESFGDVLATSLPGGRVAVMPDSAPKRGAGRTRQMVLDRYLKGWPVKRIARNIGVTRQAVEQHLLRLDAQGSLDESRREAV